MLVSDIKGGEDNSTGMVEYERFDDVMVRALLENAREYRRDTEERLLRAFRAFDPDDKGYIEVDALKAILTQRGDAFLAEEMQNMLALANREGFVQSGKFYYEEYAELVARHGVVEKAPGTK